MTIDSKKYYTVKEIMALGKEGKFPYVSSNMIFGLIRSGKLRAIRKGISRRDPFIVKGENIIKFLKSNEYFNEAFLSEKGGS